MFTASGFWLALLSLFSCYFFGGVTPQDDPSIYIDCVQHCIQTYQQHGEPGPLIVNTMGWVKGLCFFYFINGYIFVYLITCCSHVGFSPTLITCEKAMFFLSMVFLGHLLESLSHPLLDWLVSEWVKYSCRAVTLHSPSPPPPTNEKLSVVMTKPIYAIYEQQRQRSRST